MTIPHDPSTFAPDALTSAPTPVRHRQSVHSRRIFLSSTSLDLWQHRKRVHDDLERMYQAPVDMAQFGAGATDATTVSYTELATAEIVVLIVAWRYGFIPAHETRSVTELEYEEAKRLGLPVFVYLADSATEADDGPSALFPAATRDLAHAEQLAAFRARLSDANATTFDTFDTPADLSAKVVTALARRLLRREQASQQVGRYTLTPARDLDRRSFKLGDDAAATFPYLVGPVQEAWQRATQALADASVGVGGKRGIIALGEANAGKTRLALEALMHALPAWLILRWSEAFTSADVPPADTLPEDGLALFIDDLQNYAAPAQRGSGDPLPAMSSDRAATLRALIESIPAQRLIIVATCRSEDDAHARAELGWLFEKLTPVHLPQFSERAEDPTAQAVIAAFAAHGATRVRVDEWDGTLGSLALGLTRKREQYERLAARGSPAAIVLRAMKLLTLAGSYVPSERQTRAVCEDIFHVPALARDEQAWEAAVDDLLRLQFVRITDSGQTYALVIRKDTYFDGDKVIGDYPNPRDPGHLSRHLAALQRVYVALGDADGLFALGIALRRLGRHEAALEAYEQALALAPEDAATWINIGVALGRLGRTDEELAAYDRALALVPDSPGAWFNKGTALGQCARDEEALAAYERAFSLRPRHAGTAFNMGLTLGKLGRTEEAVVAYERALAIEPEDAPSWYLLGDKLRILRRFEESLVAFDRALALRPDHATTWNNKAYALLGLARYDEAIAAVDTALQLDPEDANCWDSRGEILLAAGRAEEALAAYEQALARTPDLAPSRRGKAQALRALGRAIEADALEPGDA